MAKMTFVAQFGDQEHLLQVDDGDRDDGRYTVWLHDRSYSVDARSLPSEIISVLVDNKSYDVDIDNTNYTHHPLDGSVSVRVRGRVMRMQMLEARRHRLKQMQETLLQGEATCSIVSPMPGKVVRLLVATNDTVKTGQALVVVEAMKMENELRATRAGKVKRIAAKPGQSVQAEQLLIELE
ncbi:MAG: biotin/lipoyl-containing protein [Myxococcota bacterium]